MPQKTDNELTTEAQVIRDEVRNKRNTKTRIYDMIKDLIDSKINNLAGVQDYFAIAEDVSGTYTIDLNNGSKQFIALRGFLPLNDAVNLFFTNAAQNRAERIEVILEAPLHTFIVLNIFIDQSRVDAYAGQLITYDHGSNLIEIDSPQQGRYKLTFTKHWSPHPTDPEFDVSAWDLWATPLKNQTF